MRKQFNVKNITCLPIDKNRCMFCEGEEYEKKYYIGVYRFYYNGSSDKYLYFGIKEENKIEKYTLTEEFKSWCNNFDKLYDHVTEKGNIVINLCDCCKGEFEKEKYIYKINN